jgi:pimeloyl-ACP methyl ester carboxylesterase
LKTAILLFSLLCVCELTWARSAPDFIDGVQGIPLTVQAGGAQIKGYRFLNSTGVPNMGKAILFMHGVHSNLHEFELLIEEKMKLGYDCYAFNFRGHGNGVEKSIVGDYHEGDYGFQKMVEEDFPAIMKAVREMNGGKIVIIGHSMGGMVPRASMALGLVGSDEIDSMVLIGSPPHFRSKITVLPFGVEKILIRRIMSGSGQDPFSVTEEFHNFEKTMDAINLINPLYWLMKVGLDSQWTFLKDVFYILGIHDSRWSGRSRTESIPKDIMRSFVSFQENYPYEDMRISVPTLYIVGDKDVLVNAKDAVATAKLQSEEAGYWFVMLKGVGHISLVTPAALKIYRDALEKFLESPTSLGEPNQTFLEGVPGICERFLLGA